VKNRGWTVLVLGLAAPSMGAFADDALGLVPRPATVRRLEGSLSLPAGAPIVASGAGVGATADLLRTMAERLAGLRLGPTRDRAEGHHIELALDPSLPQRLGDEGYRLTVDPRSARVAARGAAGLFYGAETLLQLLPAPGAGPVRAAAIPHVEIEDAPRFGWRSMHLDVSRHFFAPSFVRRVIDALALHKVNTLHWHLTDDQGFRLEIRRHPKLTSMGAWREGTGTEPWSYEVKPATADRPRYGGYYTQDEVREIVAYAAARHVTIVPEIEMPGHSWAALLAYPELSCKGVPWTKPADVPFEFSDPFCAGNDATFALLEDVLAEVMELFPSSFIHLGGDEAKKTPWAGCPRCQARMKAEGLAGVQDLQSWFMKRVGRFVAARGRRVIGWDEILEGGLPAGAAVMSWRGEEGGVAAARLGHDVVMTTSSHLYFNAPQWPAGGESIDLDKVYAYDPLPAALTPDEQRRVLGVGACLWSEELYSEELAEAHLLPRLAALAEIAWSPAEGKDAAGFRGRIATHLGRLRRAGYAPFVEPPSGLEDRMFLGEARLDMRAPFPGGRIHYTLDGSEPTLESAIYDEPLELREATTVKAVFHLSDGLTSQGAVGRYRPAVVCPAVEATARQRGLRLSVFEGRIVSLETFDRLRHRSDAIVEAVGIPDGVPEDAFGLELAGLLHAPKTGVYRFYLASDDGSRLFIDDALVIDHDGTHAATEKTGEAALAEGWHRVRLLFFEGLYGQELKLEWEGPGLPRQAIAPDRLAHIP
jgi:hexosaminidase